MAVLRGRFTARAQLDREQIRAALAEHRGEDLRRVAHSLSGSGATFGFPNVSDAAEALERALDQGLEWNDINGLGNALLARLDEIG